MKLDLIGYLCLGLRLDNSIYLLFFFSGSLLKSVSDHMYNFFSPFELYHHGDNTGNVNSKFFLFP